MTPTEALQHEWLAPLASDKNRKRYKLHHGVMTNLKKYSQNTGLHKLVLPLYTQFLDDVDVKRIRETFQYIDEDDSGTIDHQELR